MEKLKKYMISMFALLTITSGFMGCANVSPEESTEAQETGQKESAESITGDGDVVSDSSPAEIETIDVNEEIMDKFYIETSLDIPGRRYKTYQTSLKEFDQNKLIELLMPDAKMDEMQIETFEGGGTLITHLEEEISINSGYMSYSKDNEIMYIAELFAFAESYSQLENKELDFLSSEQAADMAFELLSQLGLGTTFGEPIIHALAKEDMANQQEYITNNDEHYRQFYEIGKLTARDEFKDEDETYYIKYSFTQDGLPVFGFSDPEIHITGGIDAPTPAYPMEVAVYISATGIRYIELKDVVGDDMESSEEKEIILLDGIKEALIKKYGDVILTEESKVTDIWLEYIPVKDAADYSSVELVPAWCCEFYVDNSDTEEGSSAARYADRFHAFTGEEIP